jgi:hypothetical protein
VQLYRELVDPLFFRHALTLSDSLACAASRKRGLSPTHNRPTTRTCEGLPPMLVDVLSKRSVALLAS